MFLTPITCLCRPSQLCVVMIFLVTVVMCRGIISLMMFRTGSPILRTEVYLNYFEHFTFYLEAV